MAVLAVVGAGCATPQPGLDEVPPPRAGLQSEAPPTPKADARTWAIGTSDRLDAAAQADSGADGSDGIESDTAGVPDPGTVAADGGANAPGDDRQGPEAAAEASGPRQPADATLDAPEPEPIDPSLYAGPFDGPVDPVLEPAPELFAAQATVRWTGARTLAGIWIAHPGASRPERVRIVNLSNGRAADGAVFSRRGMIADAAPQISSEAAQALGLRMNREAEVVIVGLRHPRAEAESLPVYRLEIGEDSDPPTAAEPSDAAPTPEAARETTLPSETRAQPDDGTREGDAPQPAAEGAETVLPPMPSAEDAKPSTDAPAAPPAAVPSDPSRPASERTSAPSDAPDERDTAVETSSEGAEGDAPGKAEPTPAEEPEGPAEEEAAADAPAVEVTATVPDDGEAPLRRFLQVGIFGQSANAADVVRRLEARGVPARGVPLRQGERAFTRVVAGPFGGAEERDRALDIIKTLGIRDAHPVRG